MTVLLLIQLVLWAVPNLPTRVASGMRETQPITAQKVVGLRMSLTANKLRFKRTDAIQLQATLVNPDFNQDIFVYGSLEWGYSASLTLFVHDASGRRVKSRFYDDALTPPLKSGDNSIFVKLQPQHLLGTYYSSTIKELNIEKPGIYNIYTEYHSPIKTSEVDVQPFFGKENGILRSNVVQIRVVR